MFPGAALQRPAAPAHHLPQPDVETESVDTTETAPTGFELPPMYDGPPQDSMDADVDLDSEPMPTVDPTAELLGTAKRKRTARARPAAAPVGAAPKKAAAPRARKTAARRTPRTRKGPDAS